MGVQGSVPVDTQRLEETRHQNSIPWSHHLLLNLELAWQPASPSGPPAVSGPYSARVIGWGTATSSFFFTLVLGWGLNSGLHTCTASVLIHQAISTALVLRLE